MLLTLLWLVWLVEGGLVSCDAREPCSSIGDGAGTPL